MHRLGWIAFLFLLSFQLGFGFFQPASPLTIQRAKTSIVPPEALPLGGYTERRGATFEPGGDELFCRTILLSQGKMKLALVSVELLTIPESLVERVRAQIPADVSLFLSATHTHCAPDSQMLNDRMTFAIPGIATFKRKWLDWMADRIAESVKLALKAPRLEAQELSLQLRLLELNRARRIGANPDRRAVLLNDPEGQPIFLHFAAHPTLYDETERKLRGDWIGAWMQEHDAPALLGAIGDVSPRPLGSTPGESVAQFVREIDKVFGPYPGELVAVSPFAFRSEPIRLDEPTPHPTFAKEYGIPDVLAEQLVQRFAPPKASITAFRLGKLAVVGVPGEPTAELARRIELEGRKAGFTWTLVCSHVNGWIGYILMPPDYERGGYEAQLSFNGPSTAERVVEAAGAALRSLARPSLRAD